MKVCPLFLLLFCTAGVVHCQPASHILGIKVISPSTFDPKSHEVKLTFINESTANITAWGYCTKSHNAPGQTVSHDFCTVVDPLVTVIWYKIELHKRPFIAEPDCPMCRLIHPGQEFTLSANFPPDVVDARIEITLIAYEGGTAETISAKESDRETVEFQLNHLIKSRQADLKYRKIWIEMGKQILADPGNQHPTASMIAKLASDPDMADMLRQFKRPEYSQGNQKEFIPDNERQYLLQFVADQEIWSQELAKNQITGVAR